MYILLSSIVPLVIISTVYLRVCKHIESKPRQSIDDAFLLLLIGMCGIPFLMMFLVGFLKIIFSGGLI